MVFNVLVGNLRMCSIPTGKHVRAQGLFSVRVATSWALIPVTVEAVGIATCVRRVALDASSILPWLVFRIALAGSNWFPCWSLDL